MKIILIRQAEPDMKWEENYDAAGFACAVESVRNRSTRAKPLRRSDAAAYRVYTGTSGAAGETAALLLELAEPPVKTPLLDDVELRPFRDTDKKCPLWQWRTMILTDRRSKYMNKEKTTQCCSSIEQTYTMLWTNVDESRVRSFWTFGRQTSSIPAIFPAR